MILKLAILTCAFYLATALIMEGTIVVIAYLRGSFGFDATRGGWFLVFAIVWFISFSLAWHITSKGLPHPS